MSEIYMKHGEMICAGPTWCIWVPLNARKLPFFCFLALRLVSRVDYISSHLIPRSLAYGFGTALKAPGINRLSLGISR